MTVDISELAGPQQDAYSALYDTLSAYGLSSLAGSIFRFLQEGFSADTIYLKLQETTEWKQRFAGNEKRRRAGYAVLSPAEYLATETAYRQVMRTYGLPEGFYDEPSDFAEALGADVSPVELTERLDLRQRVYTQGEMTGVLGYMRSEYGLTTGDAIAFFTDPDRALPLDRKSVV